MKKIGFILIISLSMATVLFSNDMDEEYCPPVPRQSNCADVNTHRLGMSMMGWGLALIAAIAIIAGTVDQSTAAD